MTVHIGLSVFFANNASPVEVQWNGFLLFWQRVPYTGSFFHLFSLCHFIFGLCFISYIIRKFIKLLLILSLKLLLLLFYVRHIIFNFKLILQYILNNILFL